MAKSKCKHCKSENHKSWNCPFHGVSNIYLIISDSERPIEKADRYLRENGERSGAKGWI